jgi:hypothetical protein
MLYTALPTRTSDERLVGPIVAFSDEGTRLAVADAISVGNCMALRISYKSSLFTLNDGCSLIALTAAVGVIIHQGELPFIPFGKEHRFTREAGAMIGFSELVATTYLRLHQFAEYEMPPAGGLVPDLTSPLPFAGQALKVIREDSTDIVLLRQRWAIAYLEGLERDGIPVLDYPSSPRFLH